MDKKITISEFLEKYKELLGANKYNLKENISKNDLKEILDSVTSLDVKKILKDFELDYTFSIDRNNNTLALLKQINFEEEKMAEKITISEFLKKYKDYLGKHYLSINKELLKQKLTNISKTQLKVMLRQFNLDFVGYVLNDKDTIEKIEELFEKIDFYESPKIDSENTEHKLPEKEKTVYSVFLKKYCESFLTKNDFDKAKNFKELKDFKELLMIYSENSLNTFFKEFGLNLYSGNNSQNLIKLNKVNFIDKIINEYILTENNKISVEYFAEKHKADLSEINYDNIKTDKTKNSFLLQLNKIQDTILKKILKEYDIYYISNEINQKNTAIEKLTKLIDFGEEKITISDFLETYKEQLEDYPISKENPKISLIQILKDIDIDNFKMILKDFDLDFVGTYLYSDSKEYKIENLLKFIDFNDESQKKAEEENKKQEELKRQYEEIIGGFMNIKEYQDRLNKGEVQFQSNEKLDVQVSAKIYLYKGIDVNYKDKYFIQTIEPIVKFAYLVNGNTKVCGVFELKKYENNDKYYLIASKNNLSLDNIESNNFYFHISIAKEVFKIPVEEVIIEELKENTEELCIDFGTSNTSVGCFLKSSYLDKNHPSVLNGNVVLKNINIITFVNERINKTEYFQIVPSVLYVTDCSNPKNIKYLIGYDAINKIKEENYLPKGKVLRSIKKGLSNLDEKVEIFDENKKITVTNKQILKDYLVYVINTAEQQLKCKFKKIHISYPVKLKELYLKSFKEILEPDYKVIEKSIDEGFAVLYDNIMKDSFTQNDEAKKAIIIDCGGGTTDLSECSFKKTKNLKTGAVELNIDSSSGDSDDFGGDKITERIFQYMKILYSDYFKKNKKRIIDDFIEATTDIFENIDEYKTSKSLYQKFIEAYEECEKIIPTDYEKYNNESSQNREMIKNNYYFLWELAEEMKKQFFIKSSIQRNTFSSDKDNKQDSDLNVIHLNRWSLSYYDDNKLIKIEKFPEITFTIKEINQLIKGDIYAVVSKLLTRYDKDLSNYKMIKLSGQSCRIDIFKEVLKEFIAGRSLRFSKNSNDDKSKELELKLSCVKGAINYFKDYNEGNVKLKINFINKTIPYSIEVSEKELISKDDDINTAIGTITKSAGTSNIEISLKKSNDLIILKTHEINKDLYKETTIEDLLKKYKNLNQEKHINELGDEESNFIFYTDAKEQGFWVLNIKKEDNKIYEGECKLYRF